MKIICYRAGGMIMYFDKTERIQCTRYGLIIDVKGYHIRIPAHHGHFNGIGGSKWDDPLEPDDYFNDIIKREVLDLRGTEHITTPKMGVRDIDERYFAAVEKE